MTFKKLIAFLITVIFGILVIVVFGIWVYSNKNSINNKIIDSVENSKIETPVLIQVINPTEVITSTEIPTPKVEKIVGEENGSFQTELIFQDSFEENNSWPDFSNDNGYGNYFGGGYRINVSAPKRTVWVVREINELNSITEISTALMGGSEDNYFGIICRYVNEDNFIFMAISSDGFLSIRKKSSELGLQYLSSESHLFSTAILHGNQWNKLTAECNQKNLRFYINNQLAYEAIDPSPKEGMAGLIVGNLSESFTEILFDNLLIFEVP